VPAGTSVMRAATGVVQEAGNPFMPSICTRHRRQEPKASSCSVAQSFGIFTSDSAAARITEVPAGTVTSWPSMVSVTSSALSRLGVPKSFSAMDSMDQSSCNQPAALDALDGLTKSWGKWFNAEITG